MPPQSSASETLYLLDGINDFQQHALMLVEKCRRNLSILSHDLDTLVYDNASFVSALSALARSSRYSQIHILVKETRPLIERRHQLVELSRRLSSKVILRKLTLLPENTDMAFMIGDDDKLLYKNDDQVYRGFANHDARAEVRRLGETFNYVWQYAEPEPGLQQLHL